MSGLLSALGRKKVIDLPAVEDSRLNRCLGTFDLTMIGVGSTLGVGLYVIAGEVTRQEAGPSVLLSFTLAAIVSALSAVCYAELCCRIPKTGSAYTFIYVTAGEFLAFAIGWNMLLELIIGAASVGRAMSQYIDLMFENRLSGWLADLVWWWPKSADFLIGQYPDILAFFVVILITVVLLLGVRTSSNMNSLFTGLNLLVLSVFIIFGIFYIHPYNLTTPDGFFPFGISGMLSGAASCFYAFVGFDSIAAMSEEATDPARSLPTAILATLVICYVCYIACSGVLVLVLPYNQIPAEATLAAIFTLSDFPAVKYVIDVGATCALLASIVGSLLPVPRIIYAMANDRLLPPAFGEVSSKETPATALVVAGVLAALLALVIDLQGLVEMMSIGTLMAYGMVAASVLLVRYNPEFVGLSPEECGQLQSGSNALFNQVSESSTSDVYQASSAERDLLEIDESTQPTEESYANVKMCLFLVCIQMAVLAPWLMQRMPHIIHGSAIDVVVVTLLAIGVSSLTLFIASQPTRKRDETAFSTPMVPILPLLAIFFNLCLIARLQALTWVRFAVWITLGLGVYFGYSIRNSNLAFNPADPIGNYKPINPLY